MKQTLRAARINAGFKNAASAAEKLGVTELTLRNYETGNTSPNAEIICKMVDVYGINFEDIDFFRH